MIFDNLQKAKEWFRQYKPLPDNFDWANCYYHDLQTENAFLPRLEFGDWILFKHIDGHKKSISRPILALFIKWSMWDMALVINFIESERAWMWKSYHEVYYSNKKDYSGSPFTFDSEVETIQFWTDDIQVLGHWKQKPTISQLKIALK